MYEGFTDEARKVMALANQEAHNFGHEYMGSEHILSALVVNYRGVLVPAFERLNLAKDRVRHEIRLLVKGDDIPRRGLLQMTPRGRQVLSYAEVEARRLGADRIDVGHLMLGIIRETDGIAAQVMMNLGINLDTARRYVLDAIDKSDCREPPSITPSPA